jgi:hypothetical protein
MKITVYFMVKHGNTSLKDLKSGYILPLPLYMYMLEV